MRKLSLAQWNRLMLQAAETLHQNKNVLSLLDAHVSGGDHGDAMDRIGQIMMDCCRDKLGMSGFQQFFTLLSETIWMYSTGFSGLLWGGFFEGMADYAPNGDEIDAECFGKMLMGGLDSLRVITKADIGDRTAMDAMIPAVQAAQQPTDDLLVMLRLAAAAARQGANDTVSAPKGACASLHQKPALLMEGQDPGAASAALIWQAWYTAGKKIALEEERLEREISGVGSTNR